jgi:glutathione S-transferase
MSDLTLYHAAPSRSSVVRWMLEELGQPYEIHLLNLTRGDSRTPEYLAVNPMGKVPALRHGDMIVTEAAAICCYLADRFPDAGLNVPIDDPRRGAYLKWLFFAPSCLEPALLDRMLKRDGAPARMLGWGDLDRVMGVLRDALARGPYLLGDRFTVADIVIGGGLRWAVMAKAIPDDAPEFAAYVRRLSERPAARRAEAKDAELAKQSAA